MVCIFSIIYSNYLLANFHLIPVDVKNLSAGIITACFTSSVFFFVFKTYDGIIRFSGFYEAIRCVSAVFCSFVTMLIFNVVLATLNIVPFVSTAALFIYFFTASFIIFGYRLIAKALYNDNIIEDSYTPVILFGRGFNSSFLMKTIEQVSKGEYKVVAFITEEETLPGKTIDNVKLYSCHDLKYVINLYNAKILFFAGQNFDVTIKNKVVDDCLEQHVKVMNIPPVRTWVHGHLNINQLKEVSIEELLGRPAIELSNKNMLHSLRTKKILITGAAGSIGSELSRQLAAIHPVSLIVCDQTETGIYNLEYELQQKFNLGQTLKIYLGDVKDKSSMLQLFDTYCPDIIFHAAAYKHVPMLESHPSEAIRNNVLGTIVLADLAQQYNVEKFLLISTDKAINPTNIMGASKRIAEIYCHAVHNLEKNSSANNGSMVYQMNPLLKRTKFITTRFGNVLGSNGSVIPRFQEQIATGGPVTITHPEIIRYFMTITEACSLVLEAAIMGNGGEVFSFDMGEPVKIVDLANKMIKLAGLEPAIDIEIVVTGLRPGEKLYEEVVKKEEITMQTHHKKIVIAKVINYDHNKIKDSINHLLILAGESSDNEVVKQMKKIVPEFISNNSVYELMDGRIAPASAGL